MLAARIGARISGHFTPASSVAPRAAIVLIDVAKRYARQLFSLRHRAARSDGRRLGRRCVRSVVRVEGLSSGRRRAPPEPGRNGTRTRGAGEVPRYRGRCRPRSRRLRLDLAMSGGTACPGARRVSSAARSCAGRAATSPPFDCASARECRRGHRRRRPRGRLDMWASLAAPPLRDRRTNLRIALHARRWPNSRSARALPDRRVPRRGRQGGARHAPAARDPGTRSPARTTPPAIALAREHARPGALVCAAPLSAPFEGGARAVLLRPVRRYAQPRARGSPVVALTSFVPGAGDDAVGAAVALVAEQQISADGGALTTSIATGASIVTRSRRTWVSSA